MPLKKTLIWSVSFSWHFMRFIQYWPYMCLILKVKEIYQILVLWRTKTVSILKKATLLHRAFVVAGKHFSKQAKCIN